jgi:ankyrin repeat protein
MDAIHRFLREYDPVIVNRLETQTRQPSLYFSAILIDHEQSYELMKLLMNHGANAHFKDNYQQTVLFYVCREGKEKCLDLLLEAGLNLNDEDIYGQTPLFYAAKENRLNIIHKLIEKKGNHGSNLVDANHMDKIAQQTPLFYAAR